MTEGTAKTLTRERRPFHICTCGDHAFVALTKGYVALCSPGDVPLLDGRNWFAFPKRTITYARSGVWPRGARRTFAMHAIILPGEGQVDHINRNGLDNRRENLRRCSNQENQRWRRVFAGKSSKFRGVRLKHATGRWEARINLSEGRTKSLGMFKTEIEAARAYDAAALRHFGEFAAPNFPEGRP